MNQIAEETKNKLIELGNYIVYVNKDKKNMNEIITESNELKVDLFLEIETNYMKKSGIETIVKEGDERSNGIGKKVHNRLVRIYHDKNVNNEILYKAKEKNNAPVVTTKVGNRNDSKDSLWIVQNIEQIGIEIAMGIDEGFKLKVC